MTLKLIAFFSLILINSFPICHRVMEFQLRQKSLSIYKRIFLLDLNYMLYLNLKQSTFASNFGGGLPILASFSTAIDKMDNSKKSNSANADKTEETKKNKQTLLSLFEINVIRYSLFIENIRPENLDPFFMIDFMSLPENYFTEDSVQKYGELFLFK